MEFRPCIDIHNGKIKQIVGSSLTDKGAEENYVSEKDGAYYGELYRKKGLKGGHIVILNKKTDPAYQDSVAQAYLALGAYPGGLQIGGGIDSENAGSFIDKGASHVIVTSFVFRDGCIAYDNLSSLERAVGKERLVLDLSCKKRGDSYYIVTDRWQKYTDERVSEELLMRLSGHCDEFLIHAAHVEGRGKGIDRELVELLGRYEGIPVTYAGGISSYEDIEAIGSLSKGRLNYTVGSALDIFGGALSFSKICDMAEMLKK